MEYFLAANRDPTGAVGHKARALCHANRLAQIGLTAGAVFALPTFWRVERDDVIAFGDAGYAWSDIDNDACALMTQYRGEYSLWIRARQGEFVGMADTGRLYFD